MERRNGFTLVEMLVIVSIVALLATLIMPTLGRVRALARRTVCGTNLDSATNGLFMYAAENGGKFPTCGYGPDTSAFDVMGRDKFDNPDSADSNSRNLFLAVRLQFVRPRALICPATRDEPALLQSRDPVTKALQVHYDFNTDTGSDFKSKCSYSYHLQFRSRDGAKGYPLTMATSDQGMALLADKNPFVKYPGSEDWKADVGFGGADPAKTNSKNHPKLGEDDVRGQNVAYLNASVRWEISPTVGPYGDNIYTVWKKDGDEFDKSGGALRPSSMPKGKTDCILVP
jgi:prepilin-type N-terminal cleavage/methylation domain-containing protein